MEIRSKSEAQRRADSIRNFRQELSRLEQEGILSLADSQRQDANRHLDQTLALLAKQFDIDTSESEKQISWGMRITSAIGGMALCAAVILFFYRFWGLLTTPVQVALLVAAPLLLVFAAEFAARRERTLYFTSLLCLVAVAAFILNLNMVGVIFNMTPSPAAFLAWGLFALALGYHFRLRLQLAAGLVFLIIWLACTVSGWTGTYWGAVMEAPEPLILAGFIVLLVARFSRRPEFPAVYRLLGFSAIFIAMLTLSVKISRSYLPLTEKNTAALYQVTGMLLAALAMWRGIPKRYTETVNLSAAFFVGFLYCRLVAWWWEWMPKYLFFLIIGLISLGLLVVFRKIRFRAQEARAA